MPNILGYFVRGYKKLGMPNIPWHGDETSSEGNEAVADKLR